MRLRVLSEVPELPVLGLDTRSEGLDRVEVGAQRGRGQRGVREGEGVEERGGGEDGLEGWGSGGWGGRISWMCCWRVGGARGGEGNARFIDQVGWEPAFGGGWWLGDLGVRRERLGRWLWEGWAGRGCLGGRLWRFWWGGWRG